MTNISHRFYSLIHLLSDGKFHSGQELGKILGVSRAAVWKMLSRLEPLGLEIHAVSGRGYRLANSFEPLDRDLIIEQLGSDTRPYLKDLDILDETDSTSGVLLQSAQQGIPSGSVCLAEFQHGGRGRRGRQWRSPYGANIYLSLLWRFQEGAAQLGGLSLAIGVALMRTLYELHVEGAGIKWPNDILIDGRKLAGILIDVAGESAGPCHVVIGVGMNYHMPESAGEQIEQPWTDLWQQGTHAGRNRTVGRLLHHIFNTVKLYETAGLEAFLDEWKQWDVTRDQTVTIYQGEKRIDGVARGIDEHGLLCLQQEDGIHTYASGEVSLRKAC